MLYTLGMIIINKLKLITITNCFRNIIIYLIISIFGVYKIQLYVVV